MQSESTFEYWTILLFVSIIIISMIAISIIDIMHHKIKAWILLSVISCYMILTIIAVAVFSDKNNLSLYLIGSFILWLIVFYLNAIFNKEKIVGKADITLMSAPASMSIMVSLWMLKNEDPLIASMNVAYIWSAFFKYLFLGFIFFFCVFSVKIIFNLIKKKISITEARKTKLPMIPAIVPAVIIISFIVMTM